MLTSIKKIFLWHLGKRGFDRVMEKYEVVGSFRQAFDRHIRKRGVARRFMVVKNKKMVERD